MMIHLVLNAGSSSLKFAAFSGQAEKPLAEGVLDLAASPQLSTKIDGVQRTSPAQKDPLEVIFEALNRIGSSPEIGLVTHRLVHGGTRFTTPVLLGPAVVEQLEKLQSLAPLHMPVALKLIRQVESRWPHLKQAAVFDTSFYADLPPTSFLYPVPMRWYRDHGIRRFGFHGLSHAYCTHRASQLLNRPNDPLKIIVCHLGSGCSVSAMQEGRPVFTSMGFTPLDGVMMATRSGSIDPGIISFLEKEGVSEPEWSEALNHQSGLLGVSEVSRDFREVLQAADQGKPQARWALQMFVDRIRGRIAEYAVNMGGVDAIVFTGGIGQNSQRLRALVCDGLQVLGAHLTDRLEPESADGFIHSPESSVALLVIQTREEWMAHLETRQWLSDTAP